MINNIDNLLSILFIVFVIVILVGASFVFSNPNKKKGRKRK